MTEKRNFIKQKMEILYLENLFNIFRKLNFNKIIIPDLKRKFQNQKNQLNNSKLLEYLTASSHPFYLCNKDKCLKIKNRKKYFIFPNNKIKKSNLFNHPEDFDMFQILFFENFENIVDINNLLIPKRQKIKKFELKLFLDNIYYDLHLISNADYTYLEKEDTIIVKLIEYANNEQAQKYIKYFELYQNDLDTLDIKKDIILDIGIKFS